MCSEDRAGSTSTKNGAHPAGSAIGSPNGSPRSGSAIEPNQSYSRATSSVVQAVATGVLLVWVRVLTVVLWHRCRQPWCDDGRPVYQRLPNGRIRFSWGVHQALGQAQRQHRDLVGERLDTVQTPQRQIGPDADTRPITPYRDGPAPPW